VGQGLVTILGQIARTELGVDDAVVVPSDTTIGSAGSSSASRQTWMTGGAVKMACEAVRADVFSRVAERFGRDPTQLLLRDGRVVDAAGTPVVLLAELLGDDALEATAEHHHRPTYPLDPETGQGDAHVAFAFAAHRAVVDVDLELGLGPGGRDRDRPRTSARRSTRRRGGPDRGRHRPGARAWR
jgi:CO/xanthine dehydrogenase Mo-binding subunit